MIPFVLNRIEFYFKLVFYIDELGFNFFKVQTRRERYFIRIWISAGL